MELSPLVVTIVIGTIYDALISSDASVSCYRFHHGNVANTQQHLKAVCEIHSL